MSLPLLALGVAVVAMASETTRTRPTTVGDLKALPGTGIQQQAAPEPVTTLHPGSDKVQVAQGGIYKLGYLVARLHRDRAFEIDATLRAKVLGKVWACSTVILRCRWMDKELDIVPMNVGGRCDLAIWQDGKQIDRRIPLQSFAYEVLIEKENAWLRVTGSNTMSMEIAGVIIDPPPTWWFELVGHTRTKPFADWPPE